MIAFNWSWVVLTFNQNVNLCFYWMADSWNSKCCELGRSVSPWSDHSKVYENFPICRSSLVLSSCWLPGICLRHWGCWLGNWHETWKPIRGDSIQCSSLYWNLPLFVCNSTGKKIMSNILQLQSISLCTHMTKGLHYRLITNCHI